MFKLLNEIKKIELLPDGEYIPISKVAEYFEVKRINIDQIINRNKDLFELDGMKTLAGEELKNYKNKFLKHNKKYKRTPKLILLNLKSVIRLAFHLLDTMIAQSIKEKVVENGIPEWLKTTIIKVNFNSLRKQKELDAVLTKSLNGLVDIQRQVSKERYCIDFLIDGNIVVECDENGHSNYDKTDEKEREDYLRSLGYYIIRFNPDGDDCVFELINKILHMANNYKKYTNT